MTESPLAMPTQVDGYIERIKQLREENAKLRELVADLWMQLLNAYDRKEVDEFADRMRELGIEEG